MKGNLCSFLIIFHYTGIICIGGISLGHLPLPGNIKLTNMNICEADKKDAITWNLTLNNINADEWKSLDIDVELHEPFTDKFTYTADIDHLNNGDWENNVYNLDGNICEMMTTHVPEAWKKMVAAFEPNLESIGPCHTGKGKYKLRGFTVQKEDVIVPPIFGKVRVTRKDYNEQDEMVLCYVMLFDIM